MEDLGVDGIILKCICKKYDGEWTDLAQDMERWQALANPVMAFRVALKCGGFLD